jgi:NADH dehydrogenase
MNTEKQIVIIGGGFGGVACALRLGKKRLPGVKIRLVSPLPHFEYHAALYRVVTGRSPLEVCIPLAEIFEGIDVEIVRDQIQGISIKDRRVFGSSGSVYGFDQLVIAAGSETTYYDTPGLKDLAFGFKSIDEALRLKRHLHEMVGEAAKQTAKEEMVKLAEVVVVGGGASGTELAAELAGYMDRLCHEHKLDPSLVTVELIQSPGRLVPDLPVRVSEKIEEKVRSLGVNVLVNRRLVKEEVETVFLKDRELKAKTLVWTAGVKGNSLIVQTKGLQLNEKGQVVVDHGLKAKSLNGIYVVGDAAATAYSGMAQTALYDGRFVADRIIARYTNGEVPKYSPRPPIYAIPAGPGWAAVVIGKRQIYGKLGWVVRRLLDLWVFKQILPWAKAWVAFKEGERLCESCEVCSVTDDDE